MFCTYRAVENNRDAMSGVSTFVPGVIAIKRTNMLVFVTFKTH